jgi:hypothetical protein
MKDPKLFKGYWFIPNEPDKKVAGILHYTPYEKLKLELIGGFEDPHEYLKSLGQEEISPVVVIWGVDQNAKKITLINCYRYGSLNFSSEFPMISYTVKYAIIGTHINNVDDKAFFKMNVELPLLTEWVNFRKIRFSMRSDDTEKRWLGFDINFRVDDTDDISLKVENETRLTFTHKGLAPRSNSFMTNVSESYSLTIEADTEADFYHFVSEAKKFSKFLTLACRTQIDFAELTLYSKNFYQELKNGKTQYRPIQLLYKQSKPSSQSETQKFEKFLFDYQKIKETFPSIIRKWYAFDKSMAPILAHLVDSINNNAYFRSVDFLIVFQALEGFHTRFKGKKKKIDITKRIEELTDEFAYITEINNIPINIAVNSRNYYSHLYQEDSRKIFEGYELYKLTSTLRKLLMCCVLKYVGFSDNEIKSIIESSKD